MKSLRHTFYSNLLIYRLFILRFHIYHHLTTTATPPPLNPNTIAPHPTVTPAPPESPPLNITSIKRPTSTDHGHQDQRQPKGFSSFKTPENQSPPLKAWRQIQHTEWLESVCETKLSGYLDCALFSKSYRFGLRALRHLRGHTQPAHQPAYADTVTSHVSRIMLDTVLNNQCEPWERCEHRWLLF